MNVRVTWLSQTMYMPYYTAKHTGFDQRLLKTYQKFIVWASRTFNGCPKPFVGFVPLLYITDAIICRNYIRDEKMAINTDQKYWIKSVISSIW